MKKNKVFLTIALSIICVLGVSSFVRAATRVDLGSADSFAVLGGSGISNTGSSVITGNIGASPTASITGFPPGVVSGSQYSGGSIAAQAQVDLTNAYNDAVGQTTTSTVPTELGSTTKTPGVYDSASGTFGITGTLTLDAQGDPSAVFIFKTGTTLTTANASIVTLSNGAQACNVFWQVGSSATLGTNSTFRGNILALTSITLTTGASVDGRILARNGLATLDTNTVTAANCTQVPSGSGAGTITVVKTVVNDNGGTKVVSDFPLFVNGTPVVSGTTSFFPAPALKYTISEILGSGYVPSFSGDCDSTGGLNLTPGDNKFCIITNNDIGTVSTNPIPPIISVVKIPNPLNLPSGPGQVMYSYILRNLGTVPVTNVTLVGDTCSPIVRTSGDTNNDGILDVTETWVHTCSTNLTETHTNIVTATGWANGISAVDVASATVIVGQPVTPPLIHVTKVPSPLTLFQGAGVVTYTNKVTNPGTVSLSNVRLVDNKCDPVRYTNGDTDGDSLLDPSETWTYTCQSRLTATTTNTVFASGIANGITARDFAVATVVVTGVTPRFPNTGLIPEEGRNIRGSVLLVGTALFGLLFLLNRKTKSI